MEDIQKENNKIIPTTEGMAMEIEGMPEIQVMMDKIKKSRDGEDFTAHETEEKEEISNVKNSAVEEDSEIEDEDQDQEDEDIDTEKEDQAQDQEIENTEPVVKEKKETKVWKEKKKRYQAEAKSRELLERVEFLEKALNDSLSSGTYHYSQNLQANLDRAQDMQRQALSTGDQDLMIKSTIEINKALNAINEVEKWNRDSGINNNYQNNNYQPNQQYTNPGVKISEEQASEMVQEWVETHPIINVNSPKYDKEFAKRVMSYVNALDKSIEKSGQHNMYYSPEYFDSIDEFISQSKKSMSPPKPKNINAVSNVSGVRNVNVSSINSGRKPQKQQQLTINDLTPEERKMVESLEVGFGISPNTFLEQKMKSLQLKK